LISETSSSISLARKSLWVEAEFPLGAAAVAAADSTYISSILGMLSKPNSHSEKLANFVQHTKKMIKV